MKVNSEIFRAYDIRGIVDEALTEEGIFQIGRAIGSYIFLKEGHLFLQQETEEFLDQDF